MLERLLELQSSHAPTAAGDDDPSRGASGPPDRLLPTSPAGTGVLRYANGEPVSDNPDELKAFRAHVAAVKSAPTSIDARRKWAKATPTRA